MKIGEYMASQRPENVAAREKEMLAEVYDKNAPMKAKILEFTPEKVVALLNGIGLFRKGTVITTPDYQTVVIMEGLPADAKCVALHGGPLAKFSILVQSETYEDATKRAVVGPENQLMPRVEVVFGHQPPDVPLCEKMERDFAEGKITRNEYRAYYGLQPVEPDVRQSRKEAMRHGFRPDKVTLKAAKGSSECVVEVLDTEPREMEYAPKKDSPPTYRQKMGIEPKPE